MKTLHSVLTCDSDEACEICGRHVEADTVYEWGQPVSILSTVDFDVFHCRDAGDDDHVLCEDHTHYEYCYVCEQFYEPTEHGLECHPGFCSLRCWATEHGETA